MQDFNICGVDEAGRGPLAGPVVAACVILHKNYSHPFLADSKKITPKKREQAFSVIIENAIDIGIGFSMPKEIDRINIRQATLISMRRAICSMKSEENFRIVVDGLDIIPGLDIEQEALVGGDALVPAISAASIVAKVMRDWVMIYYDSIFPHMKFGKHKGYGTKEHIKCLDEFGETSIHRKSFLKKYYASKIKSCLFDV